MRCFAGRDLTQSVQLILQVDKLRPREMKLLTEISLLPLPVNVGLELFSLPSRLGFSQEVLSGPSARESKFS
jgi:hypothetical protein